jgi:hypothetical protein
MKMRTWSGLLPRNDTSVSEPSVPVRVVVTPGTSISSVPRSSKARGLSAGSTTVPEATRSSRGAGIVSGTGTTTVS